MRVAGIGGLFACAALLAACTEAPGPVFQESAEPGFVVTEYDATLEPSAAVLALVPAEATALSVTDFEQLRLVLGLGSLEDETSPNDRARFWRQLPRTAALSMGMLRPFAKQLESDFGFGPDDVAWEASYSGPVAGWVLAFRDDVPMTRVQDAVQAGVGPLKGAVVDADDRVVTSQAPPEPDDAWGAEERLVGLVGREATATYVQRGCLEFDTIFGPGMQEQLAAAPAAALRALDPLESFAISFGGTLATVQLGEKRPDAFARLRVTDVMPKTSPEFGLVLARGVADPASGRLGYELADPPAAPRLIRERALPFAVCAD